MKISPRLSAASVSGRRHGDRGRRHGLVGLALAVVLAGGSGACMVAAEADVPDVEITQHDVGFAGIPMASALGDLSTEMNFSQSRPLDLPKGIDSSVKAVKIDLVAKSGIQSFDFLRTLRVTMAPQDGSTAAVELISYEKAADAMVGSTLSIPALNPVNILDQWKTDTAVFTIQIAGTLPEQDWTMDMHAHFSGKFSYNF